MNISDALSNLNTLQVFSNVFTKTGSNNLTIARNLVASTINIQHGTNIIGQLSEYGQEYSVIGNTCTLGNTTLYHGSLYYGTILNSPAPINTDFSNIFKQNPFDFVSFYDQLVGYSSYLGLQIQNSNKTFNTGVYALSGQNDINYITFNDQDIINFLTCNTIEFDFK